MDGVIAVEVYRKSFLIVLETIVERVHGYFLEPTTSLLETLAHVSAEEASLSVGAHGSTLAAQVNHLCVYIEVFNDEIRIGEQRPVDWQAAWQLGAVTEDEWQALLARLRAAYTRVRAFAQACEDWNEGLISDAFAMVGHCAYHLGEIRQGLGVLRG